MSNVLTWKRFGASENSSVLMLHLLCFLGASVLLVPKVFLLEFYLRNNVLSDTFTWLDFLQAITQDLFLVVIIYFLLYFINRKASFKNGLLSFLVLSIIVLILFFDLRVRELWIKPLDWQFVKYYASNAVGLSSGFDLFFSRDVGFGYTLKRTLFVTVTIVFIYIMWFTLHTHQNKIEHTVSARKVFIPVFLVVFITGFFVSVIQAKPYYIERNIMVDNLIHPFRDRDKARMLESKAKHFEQKVVSLSHVNSKPRRLLKNVKPFKNVVVVFLESQRMRDLEPKGVTGQDKIPILTAMANEGLFAENRVSIAHSSKSQFSGLTGRYAYPSMEIRESLYERHEALPWLLKEKLNYNTFCFSNADLAFEGTENLLRSLGIDKVFGPDEMAQKHSAMSDSKSSFGGDDQVLSTFPARTILNNGGQNHPFFSVILTASGHHPYLYPGKAIKDKFDVNEYINSITYTDKILGQMIKSFEKLKLLENTLFVFIGDHGEAHGEHGFSNGHGFSVFEEEITVPVVFWSKDGRLKADKKLTFRIIDLAPTIADLIGIQSAKLPVQGVSMLRVNPTPPIYTSSFFDDVSVGVVFNSKKYILFISTNKLLRYNLEDDPDEVKGEEVLDKAEKKEVLSKLNAFIAYSKLQFMK